MRRYLSYFTTEHLLLFLLQSRKKAGKIPAIPEIYIFNAKKSLGRHEVERGRDIFYIESSVPTA